MQALRGNINQFLIGREKPDDDLRSQLAKQKANGSDTDGPTHGQPCHLCHPMIKLGSKIIAGDRLHPLIKSHDDHHEKERDTVHDAISANGHIAAMLFQTPINQDNDHARA